MPNDATGDTEFVDFWNTVLVPKFIKFKHILVDGLSHHSEAIFPTLRVEDGDTVLDIGCGFGDTAMKPGATMTHIVWRTPDDNPWLSMAKEVVLRFLPPPGEDAQTRGPGPLSMANRDMVAGMTTSAGYENTTFERVDAPVLMGKTIEDAIDFQLAIGPAGEVFREAGDEAEKKREQIEATLAEAIDGQKREADGIVMDSSSWMVSATNPG